jgi:cyclic beta-1,2-glucan synthetase
MSEIDANSKAVVFEEPEPGEPRTSGPEDDIEVLARSLARQQEVVPGEGRRPWMLLYMDSYETIINRAVRYFRGVTKQELHLSYAAEWLLDNHYIIRQNMMEIRQDMPFGFYRQLPKLKHGPEVGLPRVYVLSRELLLHERQQVDMERVGRFLHAYQAERPLDMVELWAFPIMLRLGIIQGLTHALLRLARVSSAAADRPRLPLIDHSLRLNDEEVVANSIVSLRTITAEDWKEFFESQSLVERLLYQDPARIYPAMSFETRDSYRKVVERLGLRAKLSELEIVQRALSLAQQGLDLHQLQQPDGTAEAGWEVENWDHFQFPRQAHVGYYLLDAGRKQLEEALGYRPRGLRALQRAARSRPALVYLGSISVLAALMLWGLVGYTAGAAGSGLGAVLAVLVVILIFLAPVLTVSVTLVNWAVNHQVNPLPLPKMEFEDGLPEECATLVVIPALLDSLEEAASLLNDLEQHYLRNRDANLSFALLTDYQDAPQEHTDNDDICLAAAVEGIQRLNDLYPRESGSVFYLLHRPRRWNPKEQAWIGWERKRGKLQELNWFILGTRPVEYLATVGDLQALHGIRYILTLDADTILPPGAALRLAATLAHPLNRAEFDDQGRVTAGYTILQPRTEIKPTSAATSRFTRIFAGDTGIDLYTLAVSDVYQDLFREGIFVGKGIYDLEAFERSLEDRTPENALLSHDLFEGIHGRAGLVTDVVLLEDYPPHYLAFVNRMHRWIRGDWQIMQWLGRRVPGADGKVFPNPLSLISRWKILDNLRRSLTAPALALGLLLGWTILPGSGWFWTAVGLLTLAALTLIGAVDALLGVRRSAGWNTAWRSLREGTGRWLLAVVFLPFEAYMALDAILLTLKRLYVTREKLLEWMPAALAARKYGEDVSAASMWRRMKISQLFSAVALVLILWLKPEAVWAAAPLLIAWSLAPDIAYRISQPLKFEPEPLEEADRRRLRRLARQTWLFFEQYIGPEDHWLAPDHFQEQPHGVVAHRTSPTNIGLGLLSTLGAYDMGYIGALELTTRLRSAYETLEQLELHRGHFLNWYDTRSLEPLPPRYVSTVDSGNLAGCLLALAQGMLQVKEQPVMRWQSWEGLLDALDLLDSIQLKGIEPRESHELAAAVAELRAKTLTLKDRPEEWVTALEQMKSEGLRRLEDGLVEIAETAAERLSPNTLRRLRIYSQRIHHHLTSIQREVDVLLPWLGLLREAPQAVFTAAPEALHEAWDALQASLLVTTPLGQIPQAAGEGRAALERVLELAGELVESDESLGELQKWGEELRQSLISAGLAAKAMEIGINDLSFQAQEMAERMDFRFLFDDHRQVFHIGYNMDVGRPDANYYDLLASEARIASLTAIGKGDVPTSHWLHLGRPITRIHGRLSLLSWSATMFEYLMPLLLMRNYPDTLLHQSLSAVVEAHIRYGRERGTPWGISESGYYRFDDHQNYQYRAFGVPGLGFKRGLADDLVITPYASLLALPLRPQAVVSNLEHLEQEGMLGVFGLYEALDFTEGRLPLGRTSARVQSYMAHHQGMILLSLVNYFRENVMVERFHAHPLIQTVELLLQEQVPHSAPVQEMYQGDANVFQTRQQEIIGSPWRVPVHTAQPRVHLLSNGRFRTLITNSGAGFSANNEVELTRWRPDTTRDAWGTWIYVQDLDNGLVWSAGYLPMRASPEKWDVYFNAHMVEFRRRDEDISLVMEITIPPEDSLEIRRVTLTNHADVSHHLRVQSYAEVALAQQGSDLRHPAFSKLFVESEYEAEQNTLIFRRRPRKESEAPLFMAHSLVLASGETPTGMYETDRRAFLGRGRSATNPAALSKHDRSEAGATGATLDPAFSLGQVVDLAPHSSVELTFLTIAADSRQEALALAERYRSPALIDRAFDQSQAQAEVELRRLGLTIRGLEHSQQLLSLLLYPHAFRRAPAETLAANRKGQPGLWAYSISGDFPILLVHLHQEEDLTLAQALIQAHTYWRNRQLKIDLVFVNQQGMDYGQELSSKLHRLLGRMESESWLNRRGGIFILFADRLAGEDMTLLETAARVVLDASQGSLEEQLEGVARRPPRLPPLAPSMQEPQEEDPPAVERPRGLLFDNGLGGFSPDGREYQVYLQPGQWTPAPWTNVVANPEFGFIATEAGGGNTWAVNSGENRLTPWSNDPVSDPPGEAVYLRDEETAQVWTPTPLPAGANSSYLARHGAGYTIYEHHSHGINSELALFISPQDPVKFLRLRLQNTRSRPRRLTVTFYAEWVLGLAPAVTGPFIVTEYETDTQALLARNDYHSEFAGRVAFVAANRPLHGLTADRIEFLGRGGSMAAPAALDRIGLGGAVGPGLDACAALQVHVDLQAGEGDEVIFILGQGEDRQHSLDLVQRFRQLQAAEAAWQDTQELWDRLLGTVQVETPDPAMNLMLNRWYLYQALACRIWGRTAFYQSSGAYGFRDQLQDVMAVLAAEPDIARRHILRSARSQFEAGDVLHWWHPPSGRGVRTRITDDLLFLPYVTAQYVDATGDMSILDEKQPFLRGPLLGADEEERYGLYETTREEATLFEHCRRALEKGFTSGPNGLPLIGGGDWNDGMNRVGIDGLGESVWLGWFLYATLERFAALCERRGETALASLYRDRASKIQSSLEANAWDGAWYRRAYYDDGSPLGSSQNRECQIDAIAQSWAVLSRAGDPQRARQAMESVRQRLVRPDDSLVLLFTPPFDKTPRDPGYIKGYLPGIRENGGQYTHAATWSVWAFAELGESSYAHELYRMLNPVYDTDAPEKVKRYKVEPYVIAADVYSVPPHNGRGGWTWYTGASGWMYRLGLEGLLGLHLEGDGFRVDPHIPAGWAGYQMTLRRGESLYRIEVENPQGVEQGVAQVFVDGKELEEKRIPFQEGGAEHQVRIVMG